ncbi:MAG: hypothetical protein R2799_02895 [Crocinitomicaceae bacterium]
MVSEINLIQQLLMTPDEIMEEENRLIDVFSNWGIPVHKGIFIGFLPSDNFIRRLTCKFNVEFAGVFTLGVKDYYLFVGDKNSISLNPLSNGNIEILIKHSHPMGNELPSFMDVSWLKAAQSFGSPQKQSVILPHQKPRFSFNVESNYMK